MTVHIPVENKTKILSERVYGIEGLQILQNVFLLMYFFWAKVTQTYLKMVASLGDSAAILCRKSLEELKVKRNGIFLRMQGRSRE